MRPSRHDIWDHLDPGTPGKAALIAMTPSYEKMSKKSNQSYRKNSFRTGASNLALAISDVGIEPLTNCCCLGILDVAPIAPIGPTSSSWTWNEHRAFAT